MDLYVEWRLKNGTEQQTGALQKGFYEVVPKHLLSGELLFASREEMLFVMFLNLNDMCAFTVI